MDEFRERPATRGGRVPPDGGRNIWSGLGSYFNFYRSRAAIEPEQLSRARANSELQSSPREPLRSNGQWIGPGRLLPTRGIGLYQRGKTAQKHGTSPPRQFRSPYRVPLPGHIRPRP